MSTILKALRRLEQEKGEESPLPALDSRALVSPGEPFSRGGRSRAWLPWVVGLSTLALAVLAGGWWLLGRRPTGPAAARPASPPAAMTQATHREPAAPARPIPPPAPPAAAVAAGSPALPPAAAPVPRATGPSPAAGVLAPAPTPAPAPSVAEVAPPAPAPSAAPRPAAAPPARPAPQRASPPRVTSVARRKSPHHASSSTRRAAVPQVAVIPPAPTVAVWEIVWHPDPKRRVATVKVEGRDAPLRLHEGDAVGTLVVAEIDPGAVIFLDGTARVRKPLTDSP